LPGETHHFDALFQLAVTAPLGRVLTATAVLEPLTGDLTPADNTAIHELTVTGSYDPNDITVNYPILTLPQVQNAEKPLDYTVRFQNMGTDTAFTVVLRDTLPAAMLNLGTVQLLAASHTCTWRLGAGGVITVSFANIRLPHRTANTLRSMGFVRFRVVPRTSLALGDLIPNQAAIYFDYNAPIRTNTALTTVGNPTGVAPDAAGLTGGAWPNPTVTELHVAVTRPAGTALTLTLTDAVGRVVRTQPLATGDEQARATLDVRGLAPGLYLVRAAAGTRAWSQRVVVR
ncbi:MAG: T9SS type A sorting domain-containing protein, partial [Hymenobacteraceae bacterium]|nr:T9SS type A sorting domain-containing protein [Hymenobacteraceae bacterium]